MVVFGSVLILNFRIFFLLNLTIEYYCSTMNFERISWRYDIRYCSEDLTMIFKLFHFRFSIVSLMMDGMAHIMSKMYVILVLLGAFDG